MSGVWRSNLYSSFGLSGSLWDVKICQTVSLRFLQYHTRYITPAYHMLWSVLLVPRYVLMHEQSRYVQDQRGCTPATSGYKHGVSAQI